MIAPTELTQNYERLNTPYDPNQPIETLFQQIQDARAFTVAGGQPYGAAMNASVAYTLIFNTGLFPDACHAWQSIEIAAKTWTQFKIEFATAHHEFRLTNQTAQKSGFHIANMMIEQGQNYSMQAASEAIAQLATETASDRGTVATLTTNNAKLANQLEKRTPLSHNSRARLHHSRARSNLHGRDSDRPKQQTTTVSVGRMATKWLNRTPVRHAT
jgi:hypothetical protein